MKSRLTDKEIQRFFWEAEELPDDNKASFLLGDLTQYGVSRCQKLKDEWQGVWYEFDIFRKRKSVVTLAVELAIDFTLKDVEIAILDIFEYGGMIGSDRKKTFRYWKKNIFPKYPYDHAKYSSLRFLENLRRVFLVSRTTESTII
ncbi:MAG: hypothetical protein L6290_02180 [Thermodesulfovibrionales bacterium]|nr:hypothetical protein [Thermodesulfovibrionales bacterium]